MLSKLQPYNRKVYALANTRRKRRDDPDGTVRLELRCMLILNKLRQGSIYPQLTQAPINNYADFLNFFRGGHTIDDNLGARVIADTLQAAALNISIASGYLTKTRSMAIPNEFLADIFLTPSGSELIQSAVDRKFCEIAVELARKSIPEKDGKPHPYVGAVIVKNGDVLVTGFRGETGKGGDHGEFCALKKISDDVDNVDLSGCTVYTTLEPCSIRKPGKTPCATRLINAKVARVVYGMADKDESVYGHSSLDEANIEVGLFPKDLKQELVALNREWSGTRRKPEVAPPANDTSPLANVSYYKPGTSMQDNIHLFVRLPKDDGGFFTVEDIKKNVLAWGRTLQEIAIKWHQIDDQKVIIEGFQRSSSGSSHQLLNLI
jgi:pyrimidine deaminase RibD-like protein